MALRWKEFSEIEVMEEHVKFIIHPHDEVAGGKNGAGNTGGLFRDEIIYLWLK